MEKLLKLLNKFFIMNYFFNTHHFFLYHAHIQSYNIYFSKITGEVIHG